MDQKFSRSRLTPIRLLRRNGKHGFTLEYFRKPQEPPPYAILSHTWSQRGDVDEVTFQDLKDQNALEAARSKPGYEKLRFCADRARLDSLDYFWVDTCCINKGDLAELQRSINSMFKWYEHAAKCYVFLQDVDPIRPLGSVEHGHEESGSNVIVSEGLVVELQESRWFKRGWTLQELLAPAIVELYSAKGAFLGTKKSLCSQIASITNIPETAMLPGTLSEFSLQDRKSWIQSRETLEEEDLAYCLMGILGVWIEVSYGLPSGVAMRRLERAIAEHKSYNEDIADTNAVEGLRGSYSETSGNVFENVISNSEDEGGVRLDSDGVPVVSFNDLQDESLAQKNIAVQESPSTKRQEDFYEGTESMSEKPAYARYNVMLIVGMIAVLISFTGAFSNLAKVVEELVKAPSVFST